MPQGRGSRTAVRGPCFLGSSNQRAGPRAAHHGSRCLIHGPWLKRLAKGYAVRPLPGSRYGSLSSVLFRKAYSRSLIVFAYFIPSSCGQRGRLKSARTYGELDRAAFVIFPLP